MSFMRLGIDEVCLVRCSPVSYALEFTMLADIYLFWFSPKMCLPFVSLVTHELFSNSTYFVVVVFSTVFHILFLVLMTTVLSLLIRPHRFCSTSQV